jgi:hypothetical protein
MRRCTREILVTAGGIVLLVASLIALATDSRLVTDIERDKLLGEWVLNTELSDSADRQFEVFDAPVLGGFSDGGVGVRKKRKLLAASGGRRSMEIKFQDDDPDRIARTERMRKIVSASSLYLVGKRELLITYDRKYRRKLLPNPFGRVFSASGDELIEDRYGRTLSFWRKNRLVVETKTEGGTDIVELYSYDLRLSKLKITTTVTPSGRAGIEFHRVFDAVGAKASE